MARNRILWLLCVLGSLVFVLFYQQWLAWLLLAGVLLIPLFSLAISLPGMIGARLDIQCPDQVPMGTPFQVQVSCTARWLTPLWGCQLRLTHLSSGKQQKLKPGQSVATPHCGAYLCRLSRLRVYDRLGLFALPRGRAREFRIYVMPLPLAMDAADFQAFSWKSKKGGFSENHELRLYTPGDDLRQIHWKLTAKIGKPVIREPMIPDLGQLTVHLERKGSPDRIDRILGNLLWLGQRFLEQQIPFDLCCLTGKGIETHQITDHSALQRALQGLLEAPNAVSGTLPTPAATHLIQLGGDPDEA